MPYNVDCNMGDNNDTFYIKNRNPDEHDCIESGTEINIIDIKEEIDTKLLIQSDLCN